MKKIITIICFLSLMSSANAKGDIGGNVIKYGVIAAGVGVLAVTAQGIKEKNKSIPLPWGNVNKKADSILDNPSLIDDAMNDFTTRKKMLADIDGLLNSDKLTLTNRESLVSLKKQLEEKDKYLEKPNPYLKGNPVLGNKRELPMGKNPNLYLVITPSGDFIDTSTEFPISPPRDYDEYLTLKPNSAILTTNMGGKRKGYAAHHLIPAIEKLAQASRDVLKKYGIDINDAVNGVFLQTSDLGGNEIIHNGRHPSEYSKEINRIILNADLIGGKAAVEMKLNEIRVALLNAKKNGYNWNNVLKGIK